MRVCVREVMRELRRFRRVRSTDRGHVRKLRFAPGKGNKILLVLLHKELQVWDSAEVSKPYSYVGPRLAIF